MRATALMRPPAVPSLSTARTDSTTFLPLLTPAPVNRMVTLPARRSVHTPMPSMRGAVILTMPAPATRGDFERARPNSVPQVFLYFPAWLGSQVTLGSAHMPLCFPTLGLNITPLTLCRVTGPFLRVPSLLGHPVLLGVGSSTCPAARLLRRFRIAVNKLQWVNGDGSGVTHRISRTLSLETWPLQLRCATVCTIFEWIRMLCVVIRFRIGCGRN